MSEQQTEQPIGSAPDIPWRSSLQEAREEVRRDEKLILVYLWHHQCGGSKTMGERTYPDEAAESYLEWHFVPVRYNTTEEPEVEADFNSGWTPTIIVEDPEGREHRRSQGYLDMPRFTGEMSLARLKDAIDRQTTNRLGESRRSVGEDHRRPAT